MSVSKLFIITVLSALFLVGCDYIPGSDVISDVPAETEGEYEYESAEGVWAKDNLDLEIVGDLVEEADDAREFERMLNREDGINNLDLNGDGYADYISVREFEDRTDNQRGFSLFSRFGPEDIQEIASIIFDRDRPDRDGARLYILGNERIYGDDRYYEANWLDKSLAIADWVFGDRDEYYVSPYYVDNYPDYYDEYAVVDTPVYRDRITKYQVNPAMTKITTPTEKIMIKSPYPGRSYRRAHMKMAKPTREQVVFYRSRPERPDFVKVKDKKRGGDPPGHERKEEKFEDREDRREEKQEEKADKKERKAGKPVIDNGDARDDRRTKGGPPADRGKGNEKRGGKPDKAEKGDRGKGGGKPDKPGKPDRD